MTDTGNEYDKYPFINNSSKLFCNEIEDGEMKFDCSVVDFKEQGQTGDPY
jgi:hypothetical protein